MLAYPSAFGHTTKIARKIGPGDDEMSEELQSELTTLLLRIQNGRDDDACHQLWDAVYDRVIGVARRRIASHHRRVIDEEDVALSAIHSFLRAAENGRLQSCQHRDELWRVLFLITTRKVLQRNEEQFAAKRGNGLVRGDSVFAASEDSRSPGFSGVPDPGHPDRFVDSLIGECRERVESLPDETLRTIALLRMEGFEVAEIAAQLDVAISTIKRKLARIRQIWSEV